LIAFTVTIAPRLRSLSTTIGFVVSGTTTSTDIFKAPAAVAQARPALPPDDETNLVTPRACRVRHKFAMPRS
jgi:hypothetical protein